jgi:RNA polymerase sigma-70 factor (ECF subfamily)
METSPEELVETERIESWMREHGSAVRGYLAGILRQRHELDDLVQEVFCRAWQHRARYEERGHARTFLLRIADRLACDRLRQAKREGGMKERLLRSLGLANDVHDPAIETLRSEAAQQLHAALASLSPLQRRVLLLRYFGQLTFEEIAGTIECPLNTTLSHCRRGLEKLRGQLSGLAP